MTKQDCIIAALFTALVTMAALNIDALLIN